MLENEPVRFSRLRFMAQSAAHYADGRVEETSPMRKGTALHAYMLGGADKVVTYKGGARNPKFTKWQEFKAEHAGKHIVIPSELKDVEGARRALERHQRAMDLLDDGVQENRIFWEFDGRKCAGTPDVLRPKNGRKRLTELKMVKTSEPWKFKRQRRDAAFQCAWYVDGIARCGAYEPGPVDEVYVVAVEMKPPHNVTVFRVCESMLLKGRRVWRMWWEQLRTCERSNYFPGYAENDVDWEDEADDDALDWGGDDDVAAE